MFTQNPAVDELHGQFFAILPNIGPFKTVKPHFEQGNLFCWCFYTAQCIQREKKMSREYLTMQVHYVNTAQLHLVVGHYFPWVPWFVLTCYWRSNHKLLMGNGVWGADGGEPHSTGIRAWRSKNAFWLIYGLPKCGPQAMQQHVPTALRSDR